MRGHATKREFVHENQYNLPPMSWKLSTDWKEGIKDKVAQVVTGGSEMTLLFNKEIFIF